jgi:hypothetical protein
MPMLGVAEEALRDPLESPGGAVALDPNQHFAQMDQFVLDDPLHRGKPVLAEDAAHAIFLSGFSKRLEQ